MKKILLILFIFFNTYPMHVPEAHLAVVIVEDNLRKVDEIDKKIETPSPESQKRCPSGSSTKLKIAWLSCSATVITAVVLLVIHFTKG